MSTAIQNKRILCLKLPNESTATCYKLHGLFARRAHTTACDLLRLEQRFSAPHLGNLVLKVGVKFGRMCALSQLLLIAKIWKIHAQTVCLSTHMTWTHPSQISSAVRLATVVVTVAITDTVRTNEQRYIRHLPTTAARFHRLYIR